MLIFIACSEAPRDVAVLDRLLSHLRWLPAEGHTLWHPRLPGSPGLEIEAEGAAALLRGDVLVIALLSVDPRCGGARTRRGIAVRPRHAWPLYSASARRSSHQPQVSVALGRWGPARCGSDPSARLIEKRPDYRSSAPRDYFDDRGLRPAGRRLRWGFAAA